MLPSVLSVAEFGSRDLAKNAQKRTEKMSAN